MEISRKTIDRAINRKFIKPLNVGCAYNISKLNNERRTKHSETVSLLKQSHKTLLNVDYNLKNYNLVDANVLLRSSFEYILMAMMIQFDEGVYDEFKTLGIERDKTRICEMIDKFRTHMNEISNGAFKVMNRKEKLTMLTGLYDKLCNFTHSTLVVSTTIGINSQKEKEVLQLLMYQNYYFLKTLLFFCLNYFTHDNKHYLKLSSIDFSYLFLLAEIDDKIKKYKIDFSKYNDLLYYDKNIEYLERYKKEVEKLNIEPTELNEEMQEDYNKFVEELLEFLR